MRRRTTTFLVVLACWLITGSPLTAAVYPSQPAKRDGLLCVSGPGVTCFASATMEKRWSALPDVHTFEPLISKNAVILGSTSGLHVLDASDGAARWCWRSDGEVFSPAVDGNVVYVTDRTGQVAAMDLDDGDVVWTRRLDGWVYTPALVADRLITGGRAGVVHALDRDTGETLWVRELDQELVFRPVAVDDGVVVTTFKGSIFRLERDGRVRWKQRDPSPSFSPAAVGELLIFGGMDGVLRARDRRSGRPRWSVELGGMLAIPAQAHGSQVAAVSLDGTFALIDAGDGSLLASVSIPGKPVGGPFRFRQDVWRVLYRDAGIISWIDAS